MGNADAITVWLAVIAGALVVQVIILLVAAVAAMRAYRTLMQTLDQFQRDQLAPVLHRVHAALDEAHEVMGRMKTADENVRHALARTSARANQAASRVRAGVWPIIGLGRGVWAALASLRRRQSLPPAPGADGEARFAYEGGTSHVRS